MHNVALYLDKKKTELCTKITTDSVQYPLEPQTSLKKHTYATVSHIYCLPTFT